MRFGPGNVEELLSAPPALWRRLPRLRPHYDRWRLARSSPAMRATAGRAGLDLLREVGEVELAVLAEWFGVPVAVDRPAGLTREVAADLDDLEAGLCGVAGYSGLALSRDGGRVAATFWR